MSALYNDGTLKVNFYENGILRAEENEIAVETKYPFDGEVKFTVKESEKAITVALRVPAWCENYTLSLNGEEVKGTFTDGYASPLSPLKKGDTLTVNFDMPFKFIDSSEFDSTVDSYFAVMRGPIVFAGENCENSYLKNISSYGFEGISSTALMKNANGEDAVICNYSSAGRDWNKKITAWFKKA